MSDTIVSAQACKSRAICVCRSPQPSMAGGAHSPLELRSGSLASGVGGFHGSEDTTSDFDDTGSDASFFAAGATGQHRCDVL
jgi:hypothetical protein